MKWRSKSVIRCGMSLPPSLQQFGDSGVLTIVHRREDYHTKGNEPRGYLEPETIAIIGVSHLTDEKNSSAKAVTKIIEELQPDAVVVELCRSRTALLYSEQNPPDPRPPSGWRAAVQLPPVFTHLTAALMRAPLVAFVSTASPTSKPGAEFAAARDAALKCNAELVLGDRPLHCTLRRAWRALSLKERYLLFAVFLRAFFKAPRVERVQDEDLKQTIVTGVPQEKVLKKYKRLLRMVFPSLVRPLIFERDLYLAWSLKRCQAVKGKRCVVGVIGMAHVAGVLECLKEDNQLRREGRTPTLRFRDLVS